MEDSTESSQWYLQPGMEIESQMGKNDIDFVVLWVNPNDPLWQKTKHEYSSANGDDDRILCF